MSQFSELQDRIDELEKRVAALEPPQVSVEPESPFDGKVAEEPAKEE